MNLVTETYEGVSLYRKNGAFKAFCSFAQDREIRQDRRSTKMGEHLDRW